MNGDVAKAVRLIVRGRVQGVGYRHWMVGEARARVLRGWVRNRADGSVEALVAGTAREIEALVGACRRGPASARVANVEVMDAEGSSVTEVHDIRDFEARATVD